MKIALFLVQLTIIVGAGLTFYKTFQVLSFSEVPINFISSDSIEPTLCKGDVIFLTNFNKPFEIGDIILYKNYDQDTLIAHRIIQVQQKSDDPLDQLILTKNDKNQADDRSIYQKKKMWLNRSEIKGKVYGVIPYVGYINILLTEYPSIIKIIIGLMFLQTFFPSDS